MIRWRLLLRWVCSRPMGRRGVILHLKGWAWACYGIALVTGTSSGPFAADLYADSPLLVIGGPQVWGWLWIGCGVYAALSIAVWAAVPHRDWIMYSGWSAAIVPPIVWSSLYGFLYLFNLVPGAPIEHRAWWTLCAFWAFIAWLVRVIAGWEEPLEQALLDRLARLPENLR